MQCRLAVDGKSLATADSARTRTMLAELIWLRHPGITYTVGSGFTDGLVGGASVPLFNCHTLHGSIDAVQIWNECLLGDDEVMHP